MKSIWLMIGALICALMVPVMAQDPLGPSENGMDINENDGAGMHHGGSHQDGNIGEHDWLSPGAVVSYSGISISPGSTVVRYTSTGHTFHGANYNSKTGVTTIYNPRYINTRLYSHPLQLSDGSIVLYGYNGYYPFGFDSVNRKLYFYGTNYYYQDYSINDPWFREVALPFLRDNYGFIPGPHNIAYVYDPYVTYTYSNYVHYGNYDNWLGFV